MIPRPLNKREQDLIKLYTNCQMEMTPKHFYSKWQVSHEQLAQICSRSLSTVRCWFLRGRLYRRPLSADFRLLALMDFLLEHFEELSPELLYQLCPRSQPIQESQTEGN